MKIASKFVTVVIFICLSVGAVLTVFASGNDHWPELKGKIVSVDAKRSVVTIKNVQGQRMTFQVLPTSEIKIKSHGLLKWNRDAALKDLNVGQWISVIYYGSGEVKVARNIKIFLDVKAASASL